jgi:hypothetical protein
MYFVDQIRVLAASLPQLARLLFLGQMLGGSLFLFWLLRSRNLRKAAETNALFSQALRAIATIGLVLLTTALLANMLGYFDLGNLLAIIFLKSVYIAAMLYTAVRILEGLIIIALQVKPLSLLRVVGLYRPMLQQRAGLLLGILAFLLWLNLILGFFGLLTPLIAATKATLSASIVIGSLSISLGGILAFVITIWATFLISRFLRFLLEEDVYQYFLPSKWHSVCDFNDTTLYNPACGILHCPGSAWNRFDKGYDSGWSLWRRDRIWTTKCDQ